MPGRRKEAWYADAAYDSAKVEKGLCGPKGTGVYRVMNVRKHFYFSGRVQGVGFRYQATRLARGLGLTGYVQNLWDGRVEMEAQGPERQVWDLVSALHRQPYIQIEDMEVSDRPLKEERGFQMAN